MTDLNDIYEVFLSLIDDDLIAIMLNDGNEEDVKDLFLVYLKGAISEFKFCKKNLEFVVVSLPATPLSKSSEDVAGL